MSKNVEEMSAQELFALAERKRHEEQEAQKAEMAERIEALKEKRKELKAEHKKALTALESEFTRAMADIDKELEVLGAKPRSGNGSFTGGRKGSTSNKILAIIGAAGKIKSTDIRDKLEAEGIDTKNLNQQLAYLKRNGKVSNPGRGVYAIVK